MEENTRREVVNGITNSYLLSESTRAGVLVAPAGCVGEMAWVAPFFSLWENKEGLITVKLYTLVWKIFPFSNYDNWVQGTWSTLKHCIILRDASWILRGQVYKTPLPHALIIMAIVYCAAAH